MIIKNERKKYASDLTDSQWEMIAQLFPPAGNKSKWEKRELVDAVLYLVDNDCKWRNLPHDFPPHTTGSAQERGIDGKKRKIGNGTLL